MPNVSSRSWEALKPPLAEWILDAVSSMGFRRMTPVQASAIPLFLGHKDVVVEAVTGSGKTLAFLIPVIEKLLQLDEPLKKHHIGAIIVSPTRELASQIYNVLHTLLAFHGPSAASIKQVNDGVSGGDTMEGSELNTYPLATPRVAPQLLQGGKIAPAEDLRYFLEHSPNLLISTPGRLLELLSSPHVHCPQSSFEVLVLDEADRLLDLGFKEDLQKILSKLPKQRRTGLFSASVSEAVDQIIRVGLRNPVKIVVKVKGAANGEDQRTPASLQLKFLTTPASHKFPAFFGLLSRLEPVPHKSIVYLSTCAAVDYFQYILPSILPSRAGTSFSLIPLHGKLPPKVRHQNFTRFSTAINATILLTTDVAARGLDIPQVDLVIQIDPPSDPKVFLHRCGRAGRAGRKGLAVILLQPGREEDYVSFLSIRKTPVTPLVAPPITISSLDAIETTDKIRKMVRADRALHDRGQRGFVSWVQAYTKHQTSSIFRIADIDWTDAGAAWGLLKLPKMPELKRWEGDKSLGVDLDLSAFAYKDKKREQMRTLALQESQEDDGSAQMYQQPVKQQKGSWSLKHEHRDEREIRRRKKVARREREKWERMTSVEREEKLKLERLIEDVKRKETEEFHGFDD